MFVPASSSKFLVKASTLPADAFIVDLEDAVAPSAKEAARENVAGFLRNGGIPGKDVFVRVNHLNTPWGRHDVARIADLPNLAGIALPKVESAEEIRELRASIHRAGGDPDLPIWAGVETPRGVLRVDEVLAQSPTVTVVMAGTQDLTKDLRARHRADRLPLLHSLSHLVLAARAHGRLCLDGVHTSVVLDDSFRVACEQGRDLGFDGKCLIHPSTIDVCHQIFSPSEADVAFARRVVQAAEASTDGVVVVDNRIIEVLHVQDARRILAIAERIEASAVRV